MRALSRFIPSAPPPPPCLLARGEAFFVRRVTLAEGEPAPAQLLLAIEGMAPFPPEQLYHGHVLSADGRSALVFAGFRRRFTNEETASWTAAPLVTAEFVALLASSGKGERILVHTGAERITALAWRSGEDLPVAVLVRQGGESEVQAVVQELRARAEFGPETAIVRLSGALALRTASGGAIEALCAEQSLGVFSAERLAGADVRDPDFLLERRRAEQRDVWLWRGMLGVAALIVCAALLDTAAGALGVYGGKLKSKVVAQTEAVRQTETAQALANRIAELNEKRLMPFEMLALVNPSRPDSVVFQRVVTRGLTALEIEAQANNAEDVGSYTNTLKALPALASVNTRVDGARDGVTRFVLTLEFKPESLRDGGAR